jgi:hypothetical protein
MSLEEYLPINGTCMGERSNVRSMANSNHLPILKKAIN